ncbi:MAG: hypothetical protein IJO87_01610 [Eggerthellaceae bacterium]|nr:hypothetical protein [Eggerthellaceae bacterium]
MKKNKVMRFASVVLVMTLLSTCMVGGTFAKYTTQSEVEDDARVAYWGWGKAAAIEFDMFDSEYKNDGDVVTVKSEDGDNVVAPGTKKSATFAFAYTNNTNDAIEAPEVDYTFSVDFEVVGETTEWDKNANFVWTLDGNDYQTVALLKAAVLNLAGESDGSKDYKAGALPTGFGVGTDHDIGWKWIYSEDAAGDVADTALGNMDPLDNVSFTITITATQID